MRSFLVIPVLVMLVAAPIGTVLAASPSLAPKDLMKAELSSIRRDVANKNWTSAWLRSGKFNGYWSAHCKTHSGMKAGTIDNYRKLFKNLQTHLRERSAAKVYIDLTALWTFVIALKV